MQLSTFLLGVWIGGLLGYLMGAMTFVAKRHDQEFGD